MRKCDSLNRFATREPKTRMASLRMAFGLPGATSVRVWDWPGVRLVDTTADAVTGVTALTLWPVAMVTTSAGAAVVGTVLCWVWTTWAVAVPVVCGSKYLTNKQQSGTNEEKPTQQNNELSQLILNQMCQDSQTGLQVWLEMPDVYSPGTDWEELQPQCLQSHSHSL